jgi:pimeloyl-ACP methyl ester carboxylesterase
LAANIGRVLPAAWRSKVGRRFRSDDYRTTTGIMSQVFLKVIGQNASSVASKIKTETLLIYGNDDQTTPPAMGRQFNRLIVGSKLELVERAGHYVHLDQPGRVEKLIKDFIK